MREIFAHPKLKIIESDRAGGVSAAPFDSLNLALHTGDDPLCVEKNREIFASFFDVLPNSLAFMDQIHGNIARVIDSADTVPSCDALITNKKELVLCVMVADCVPVIIYDAKMEVIAAIHAGRKGAFSDIITKVCETMKANFAAKELTAYIGTSIRSCCYEIKGEVLDEARENFPYALNKRGTHHFLSLQTIIKKQLNKNGVKNIKESNTCSCCDKNYFSYRRDGACGRFAVGVKLNELR